jgi:prepilin-type processing-associated H-X9-DG protein
VFLPTQQWTWKGDWWISGRSQTYTHTQLPNRRSCWYGGNPPPAGNNDPLLNMQAASSYHPGGVNVAFMDGSVRFIKSNISPYLWYAIATPNQGEQIDSSGF